MNGPACADHGFLVRDLALGRLDDESAARADGALATCPVCGQWWEETFAADACVEVDAAVGGAIADFAPPRAARRLATGFLAAAAVLLLGLGVATVARLAVTPPSPLAEVAPPVEATETTLVASMDFESGLVDLLPQVEVVAAVAPPAPKPAPREAVLNAVSMETGDLSGWSSHS